MGTWKNNARECIRSCDSCDKPAPIWWLETTEMYPLTVAEVRSPNSESVNCKSGEIQVGSCAPSAGCKEANPRPLPIWGDCGPPSSKVTSPQSLPGLPLPFPSVSNRLLLPLIRTSIICRLHPDDVLILRSSHSSHSESPFPHIK